MNNVISEGVKIPIKIWTPLEGIEESAVEQMKNVANLPFGFNWLAIMPDVHTGFGATIGTVSATTDCIVPSSVGVDIGCGMMAIKTPFEADKVKSILPQIKHSIERSIPTGFNSHRKPMDEGWAGWAGGSDLIDAGQMDKCRLQMGTLGGGNHFIEICLDESGAVWVMLHSGSRHIGLVMAKQYISKAKDLMDKWHIELADPELAYLPIDSREGGEYLERAKWAQGYAMQNRETMMRLIMKDLAYALNDKKEWEAVESVNCHHNYVEQENHYGRNVWITRKGAIRARAGEMGIIPGSMGAKSFIVRGKGNPESFCSASHGAGRKMGRKEAKRTFTLDDFNKQMEGILCTGGEGVIDEIPSAYKDIDEVMANQGDLVEPVHTLKQIMVIKGGE